MHDPSLGQGADDVLHYRARSISIPDPGGLPKKYFVFISDPFGVGDADLNGNPVGDALPIYAEDNSSRTGLTGMTYCGSITVTHAGNVTGTAGGSVGPRV